MKDDTRITVGCEVCRIENKGSMTKSSYTPVRTFHPGDPTVIHDADHVRLFDYGTFFFPCGHAQDKRNNALEAAMERSYKSGHW